jgi:uncharacterized protein
MFIKRQVQEYCLAMQDKYPVITIIGPRQSGKTTLAKHIFPDFTYVNLERPDMRKTILEDPQGFLQQYPEGLIIDEIQRAPELPSYIQVLVDETQKNGQYILTGSQNLLLSNSISQSLAGRTAIVKLLPFSMVELKQGQIDLDLYSLLFKGSYPRLYKEEIAASIYYENYLETYIQRDLRVLSQIDNLYTFERFLRILAGRTGQLINYTNIANDLGLSHTTIRKWLSILELSFIIFTLYPYTANLNKRLTKTPKLYFYDTGLAAHLIGIENPKQLQTHPLSGNLFENFVIGEHLKARYNHLKSNNLSFFRDRTGHEVDLLLDQAGSLTAIEIKLSATIQPDFAKQILWLEQQIKQPFVEKKVLYTGKDSLRINGIDFTPWTNLAEQQSH